jgi:NAD(P)-dependent dehydrogenase (short-subunit alcohol dehydrogenase family)
MKASRIALVTGSSGGIGRAIAGKLATNGMSVAVVARRDERYPATPQDTVDEIRAAGGHAVPFECDLSVIEDRAQLVPRVMSELGPIDVLVNNAMVSTFEATAEFRSSRLSLVLDVQVRAVVELCQAMLPAMRERGAAGSSTSARRRHCRHSLQPLGLGFPRAAAPCMACARPPSSGSRQGSPRRSMTTASM